MPFPHKDNADLAFLARGCLRVVFDFVKRDDVVTVWTHWRNTGWKDLISHGLAPAIVGLAWSGVLAIGKGTTHSVAGYAIGIAVKVLMLRTKVSAPALIGFSGLAGIALLR